MPSKKSIEVTVTVRNAEQLALAQEEVRRQEESGQFNTVHHEVLKNLLDGSVAVEKEEPNKETD